MAVKGLPRERISPGPWKFRDAPLSDGIAAIREIQDALGHPIADVAFNMKIPPSKQRGNGTVMAGSYELYEAVKAFVNDRETCPTRWARDIPRWERMLAALKACEPPPLPEKP